MTAFTFAIEQLRAAPPEVRRWFAGEIARAFGGLDTPWPEKPRPAEAMSLAACTPAEALQVFELIGGDAIATRLFFELAREGVAGTSLPGLHAMRLSDLLHHAGLPGEESLFGSLAMIDRAFRQVRGDGAGSLFGFDEAGHLFLHESTQLAIRRVWRELVEASTAAERQMAHETMPQGNGFVPRRVGPSEDIASHAARPLPGNQSF